MMSTLGSKSKVEISKRLVLINSASSLVTRLLSISVLIWLQQYLLKRITPEEYSLLPVLYSVMMFAPLVTTILTGGLGRYIVEAYAKDDDERVTQIVSTMFPILCVVGLVFLICGWTFAWYIGSVLNIAPERLWDARIMMALLMFSAAVRLPLSPFGVGLYVRQKYVLGNIIGVSTEIFRLTLLFSLLFGIGTRVMWVVTASVCAEMLSLAIGVIVSRRLVPMLRFRPSHIYWPIAKELTSFGGWSFVASLADTIRTSADVIILNRLGTPTDVTCFHVGTLAMSHIHGLYLTARGPLQPALTALHATDDKARLQNVYVRGGRLALWAALLPAVPLMVFSRELITLYVGEQYIQAGSVMLISLTLFPIAYGSSMTVAMANAKKMMRPWALIIATTNLVNLVLTFYFVGQLKMGAVGSVTATMVAVCFFYPLFVFPLGLRLVGVSLKRWLRETMIPGLCPAVFGAAVGLVIELMCDLQTWPTLILAMIPGGLVYTVGVLVYLGEDDRLDMQRVWEKARGFVEKKRTATSDA